jgi:hypothetical protein
MVLDHDAPKSKSSHRRERGKVIKQQMWEAIHSAGTSSGKPSSPQTPSTPSFRQPCHSVLPSEEIMRIDAAMNVISYRLSLLETSWWQQGSCFTAESCGSATHCVEPLCPPGGALEVGKDVGVPSSVSNEESCTQSADSEDLRIDHGNDEASPNSGISSVVRSMDSLQDQLCEWLYGDGPCGPDVCLSVHHQASHDDVMTMEKLCENEYNDVPQVHDDVLDEIRSNIAKYLFCLEDWARWKKRGYSDEEACLSVESWFEDGYIGRTSNGWGYIEDEVVEENDKDEERVELEENWMGNLFVYGRAQFITILHAAPASQNEFVVELIRLASQVTPIAEHSAISKPEFERLYFNHSTKAFEWQEEVPDGDDCDSLLLSFFTKMRQLIKLE